MTNPIPPTPPPAASGAVPAQIPETTPANAAAAKPGTSPAGPSAEVDPSTLLDEPLKQAWYRRPLVWAGVLALLLAGGGIWWWQARKAANAAPVYNTQAAARGNLTLTVTANGTLQPTRTINIGSELSGTVLKVNVDVNDQIKKGQVLVVLDTAKLTDQILRSRAALSATSSKVEQTQATVSEAAASLARYEEVEKLSGGKVPSKAELDGARATLKRARADDASAQAGVREAAATLSTDETNLSKASIRAPADGVVLTRTVDPGNAVAASLQAVTLFTLAEDLTKLRLWVYVDEADVSAVKLGQSANFTVSAYLSRQFPARITRVGFGSTITATQRTNVLLVPNTALRFTPTVAASPTAAKGGVMASLTPRMPGSNNRKSAAAGASTALAKEVWVLPKDGVPVAVAVTPGISDGHMTEITGGELVAGMAVITDQKTAVK